MSYFQFFRLYPNDNMVWLSTDARWSELLLTTKGMADTTDFSQQISHNKRYYLWEGLMAMLPTKKRLICEENRNISRQNFNLDLGLLIVEVFPQYQDYFLFGVKPDMPCVPDYCLNNIDLFEQFIFYFKDKSSAITNKIINHPIQVSREHTPKFKTISKTAGLVAYDKAEHLLPGFDTRKFCLEVGSVDYLTRQEFRCVSLLARGRTVKQAARILDISPRTVEDYLMSARVRLDISSNSRLIMHYWQSNLSNIDA